MTKYTDKELELIKQCKEGPFYTRLINLNEKEYNDFIDKLIKDNNKDLLIYIIALYNDYNCEKIFDYFLKIDDVDSLICFLNTNYDFGGSNSFDANYIITKLKNEASREFIEHFLEDESVLYFLRQNEINLLKEYINER